MTCSCAGCDGAFEPAGRGSPQRFCGGDCRAAFHRAARRWALAALERGELTVAQLKEGPPETVYGCSKGLGAPGPVVGAGRPGASRRGSAAAEGPDDPRFI